MVRGGGRAVPGGRRHSPRAMGQADAELDQQLEDAESATSEEERGALYEAIQKRIMDEAIIFALHNQVQMIGHTSDMSGFRFAPGNWQVRFYDVTTN